MRTARCAGASISKTFDHEITVFRNFLAECDWCWLRECGLLVVLYLDALGAKRQAQALHEQVAARLGNIEQAYCQAIYGRRSCRRRFYRWRAFGRRIKNNRHCVPLIQPSIRPGREMGLSVA